MDIHKNARLTPHSRADLVHRVLVKGETPKAVATAFGVSVKTVNKWGERFQAEGPRRVERPLVTAASAASSDAGDDGPVHRGAASPALDRQADRPGDQRLASHVSRILKRQGLNKLKALEPAEPVRRYEREHPGELIHIDIKKLGRIDGVGHRITGDRRGQSNRRARGEGLGWEFVHFCIDDASRIAFAQVMPDEKKNSAVPFLKAAVAYYGSLGVTVARVMTDNGSCYKSFDFRDACRALGLRHIRTKPYTPKTNGKAKRFIQTALRDWAYAQAYSHSDARAAELPRWLHRYNWHRSHGCLKATTPTSRLGLTENNLMRLHS